MRDVVILASPRTGADVLRAAAHHLALVGLRAQIVTDDNALQKGLDASRRQAAETVARRIAESQTSPTPDCAARSPRRSKYDGATLRKINAEKGV